MQITKINYSESQKISTAKFESLLISYGAEAEITEGEGVGPAMAALKNIIKEELRKEIETRRAKKS